MIDHLEVGRIVLRSGNDEKRYYDGHVAVSYTHLDEKEYRYARFLNIKELLERMTVSIDENNKCYRINARLSENNQKYIISMKISFLGEIIHYHCSCQYETIRSCLLYTSRCV